MCKVEDTVKKKEKKQNKKRKQCCTISSLNFNNNTRWSSVWFFSFNLLRMKKKKNPHYVKHSNSHTHCRAESPSSPQSLLSRSLSAFHTLPHSLQHMPTHAAAQAHVIWNCIFPFPSLSPLSVSHMHTCACTPRTRFPFELSWQLGPPLLLLLLLSPSLSFLSFLLQFKIKSTLYCLDRDETCASQAEHIMSSSEIQWWHRLQQTATNTWIGSEHFLACCFLFIYEPQSWAFYSHL